MCHILKVSFARKLFDSWRDSAVSRPLATRILVAQLLETSVKFIRNLAKENMSTSCGKWDKTKAGWVGPIESIRSDGHHAHTANSASEEGDGKRTRNRFAIFHLKNKKSGVCFSSGCLISKAIRLRDGRVWVKESVQILTVCIRLKLVK